MEIEERDLPHRRSGSIDRKVAREGGVIAMFSGTVLAVAGAALAVFGKVPTGKGISLGQVKAAGLLAAGAGTAVAALGKGSYSSARDAYAMEAVREVLEEETAEQRVATRILEDAEAEVGSPLVTINMSSSEAAKSGEEKSGENGSHVTRLKEERIQSREAVSALG